MFLLTYGNLQVCVVWFGCGLSSRVSCVRKLGLHCDGITLVGSIKRGLNHGSPYVEEMKEVPAGFN